jgi:hypothetical protein
VDGSSGMKDYHTDLITFVAKNECMYVFKNDENVKIMKGVSTSYTIPKRNLIAKKILNIFV